MLTGLGKHHNPLVFIIFCKFAQTPKCWPVEKLRFDTVFLCEADEFLVLFFLASNGHAPDILGPRQKYGAYRVFAENFFHNPWLLCLSAIEFHIKFDHTQGCHLSDLNQFNKDERSWVQDSHHLVACLPQIQPAGQHLNQAPRADVESLKCEQPRSQWFLHKRRHFALVPTLCGKAHMTGRAPSIYSRVESH